MARRTVIGDAGIGTSVMPIGRRASTTALMTAGVAAMVPASPMPFTPIGLEPDGVTVWSNFMFGSSAADGTR